MAGVTWYLYVVRTVGGHLYAGVTTDVARRYPALSWKMS